MKSVLIIASITSVPYSLRAANRRIVIQVLTASFDDKSDHHPSASQRTPFMKTAGIYVGLSACTIALVAAIAMPGSIRHRPEPGQRGRLAKVGEVGDESAEAQTKAEQYAQARTAPGVVLPGAYSAAFASLNGLPVFGTTWTEVTNRPYNSDDPRYRDPFASNSSSGNGLVSGRITGLAVGGGDLFIGGANGGVFRSADKGQT